MNLDKAIKLLHSLQGETPISRPSFPMQQAIQLGIEALKRVRDYKKAHIGLHYTPMLGETED